MVLVKKYQLLAVGLLVGLSATSFQAIGEDVNDLLPNFSPSMGKNIASDLAKTQSETQLLKAQIDKTKALVELATIQLQMQAVGKKDEKEEKEPVLPFIEPVVEIKEEEKKEEAPKVPANVMPAPPEVVAVFGVGDTLYASLLSYDGRTFDVKKGDRIDDDYRVQRITPELVTLTRDGKSFQLRIISANKVGVNLNREIPVY